MAATIIMTTMTPIPKTQYMVVPGASGLGNHSRRDQTIILTKTTNIMANTIIMITKTIILITMIKQGIKMGT